MSESESYHVQIIGWKSYVSNCNKVELDVYGVLHLQAMKRVLRYLKGIVDLGVIYQKKGNEELMAYTNNDYAEDVDDKKVLLTMCSYLVKELCHGPL